MTKRTRLIVQILGGGLLLTMSTIIGFAQTSGEITGLVTDPIGRGCFGCQRDGHEQGDRCDAQRHNQ